MSTDIGALEKQYAKLRRKQHHACVVISGIKPGRSDTDGKLEKDNQDRPTMVELSKKEENEVEDSVAMLTLSVPVETEMHPQDLTDPISPTIFGETKCVFVQNLKKKKTKEKHFKKHSKRSNKHCLTDEEKSPTENQDSYSGLDEANDKLDHSKRRGKKVCFSDEIKVVESDQDNKALEEINIQDGEIGEHENNVAQNSQEIEHLKDDEDSNGNGSIIKGTCSNNVNEENCTTKKVDHEFVETEPGAGQPDVDTEHESQDSVKDIVAASGSDINDIVKSKNTDKDIVLLDKNTFKADNIDTATELHSNNLKTSRTHGLRNPAVKYSKQYYPSSHITRKKQRTYSESAKNTNRESIYQHFTMTKRQLSMDSALGDDGNKTTVTPTKKLEFPFPVHSINEHKIKAGMKLGLYDQKALEKMEKTRKIQKSKLPNLTFE